MDESLKNLLFKGCSESPGSWLMSAIWLKRAAEEIDYYKHEGVDINTPEGDFVFMMGVYNLLLGYSFENLLKGIVVAHRGSAGSVDKMDKDLTTHNMGNLLNLNGCTNIPISDDEKKLLRDLQPYVRWAGRYPLPKVPDDLIPKVYSRTEYKERLKLWERLYAYLKRIGWITKMDGSKLMTDKPKEEQDNN
ncbi:MAG: hypothetical protein ACYS21_19665 [Planctomycetota bacterium]|jgi:hypothetical protein